MTNYLEVELRYKVDNVEACIERLESLGVRVKHREHLIDTWYMPETITNLADQRSWFDRDHGIAWRIRQIEQADGSWQLDVTSKQLTDDDNHNSFHETTANFDSLAAAQTAMDDRDYYNWLTIDKTRYTFTSSNPDISDDEYELVLDYIAGLAEKIGVGACLEIEHKGSSTREEALDNIEKIAGRLGYTKDDLFEKSLTVVSMTELAHF